MKQKHIIFRGVQVIEGWPELLAESQQVQHVVIGAKKTPRIRYGSERDDWGADRGLCHDCAAIKGEYHAIGCDVERCPKCGGQAISCDCADVEDDE